MSDAFTFRPLLKLRKRHEDISRQAFAEAQAQADAVQKRLAELRELLAQQNAQARKVIQGCPEQSLAEYRRCVTNVLAAIDEQEGELQRAMETLTVRRDELVEAMKQRQAMAAMQAKFEHADEAQEDRREAKEQDDLHVAHTAAKQG